MTNLAAKPVVAIGFLFALVLGANAQLDDPVPYRSTQVTAHGLVDWSALGLQAEPRRPFADQWKRWRAKPSHPLAARIVADSTYQELEQVALWLESNPKVSFDSKVYFMIRIRARLGEPFTEGSAQTVLDKSPAIRRLVLEVDNVVMSPKTSKLRDGLTRTKDPATLLLGFILPVGSKPTIQRAKELTDSLGPRASLWLADQLVGYASRTYNSTLQQREYAEEAQDVLSKTPKLLRQSPYWPLLNVQVLHLLSGQSDARRQAERYLSEPWPDFVKQRFRDYMTKSQLWRLRQ